MWEIWSLEMDRKALLAGNNRPEDVKWLFSLSESELDSLISLKKIAIQRAEIVGHEALAKKFDLKTLRMIGYVIMQHVKKQVAESPVSGLSESAKLIASSNLTKLDLKSGTVSAESFSNEDTEDYLPERPESRRASKLKRQKHSQ